MRHRLAWLAAALISAPAAACGPDFPDVLLDSRAATLSQLPAGVFAVEAMRLVPRPDGGFKPVERADWLYMSAPPDRTEVERAMLGDDFERAWALRESADAKTAYAQGKDFSEDVRRYLAGAAAYAHEDYEEAERRFASVIELPPDQRTHYGVWAEYMIGEIESGAGGDRAKAANAFQQVRAMVAAGAADSLGLAVDSYGEEARLALDDGDDAKAIGLYAQQTTLGSLFGEASLLEVARKIVRDPPRLARAIDQPITQKLVALYLMTRSGELGGDEEDSSAASSPSAKNVIDTFLDAIDKRGLDHIEGAGRLAALAYRSGRYDLAAKLSAKDSDGYATWVRAKLALRDGNAEAAAAAYADAVKAFPADDHGQPMYEYYAEAASDYCRVEGEAGTLALARNEYVDGLEHLYAASPTYWMDAAFVAERVLTPDELTAFVAKHAATPIKTAQPDDPIPESSRRGAFLRALLARRLLRSERYDEAVAYFDDAELKRKAIEYAAARKAVTSGGPIDQAGQWFKAAKIAREDGMELLGYELDPDNAFFGGNFESFTSYGYGPSPDGEPPQPVPTPLKIDAGPSTGERGRVMQSIAKPNERFHYRYVAADLASRAADLVPHRSQAYAAMLCQAAGWVLYRNPEAARAIYDRYVKDGPHVAWAEHFGTQCEEPDFAAAAARLHLEHVRYLKHLVRTSAPYVAMAGLAIVGVVAFFWRKRKARTV